MIKNKNFKNAFYQECNKDKFFILVLLQITLINFKNKFNITIKLIQITVKP